MLAVASMLRVWLLITKGGRDSVCPDSVPSEMTLTLHPGTLLDSVASACAETLSQRCVCAFATGHSVMFGIIGAM